MPETSSPDLWRLVRSLDKGEKRHFRMVASSGPGRPNQFALALYDLIDASEEWNPEKMERQLREKGMEGSFSVQKTRLFEQILSTLRGLRAGKSIPSTLQGHLEDIQLLFQKGLLKSMAKRLRKTRKLALHYEEEEILLVILAWEQKLFLRAPHTTPDVFFAEMERQENRYLDRIRHRQGLLRLHEQMRAWEKSSNRWRNPAEKAHFDAIRSHPFMQQQPPPDHFLARVLRAKISGSYAFAAGNINESHLVFRQLMAIWDEAPHQVLRHLELYLSSINNFLNIALITETGRPSFMEEVRKFREMQGLPKSVRLRFQRIAFAQELNFHLHKSHLGECRPFLAELEDWLERHRLAIGTARELVFYHNLSQLYFLNGHFSFANRWNNHILGLKAREARRDITDFARLSQLVHHFELGNVDLLEHLYRSAARYFHGNAYPNPLARALLPFFRPDRNGEMDWEAVQLELEKLRPAEDERPPLGWQELVVWVEGKLLARPIEEMWALIREQ